MLGRQHRRMHRRAQNKKLGLLPRWAMLGSTLKELDTPMPEAKENSFFDKYWPALADVQDLGGENTTAPPSSQDDEASVNDEHRAAKQARKTVNPEKAGQGKGSGQETSRGNGGPKRRDRDHHGQSNRSWGRSKWDNWGSSGQSETSREKALEEEISSLKQCVFAMQKLALRHEDFLCCLRAEVSWVLFLRVDMRASIVPPLYTMQQEWRKLKEQSPDKLTSIMRVALVKTMFREFGKRLEMLPKQDEQLQLMRKLGWMQADALTWHYVKWDPTAERLVPIQDKPGVTLEQVAAVTASIQQLADSEDAIMRFHPSRPLEKSMGGKNLTFTLQMSLFGDESGSIKEHLELLSGLAATQLIGLNLRRERPGRSNLANLIQKYIQQ